MAVLNDAALVEALDKSVGSFDLVRGKTADPVIEPPAICKCGNNGNLVGQRRVVQSYRDAVIVGADIERIFVCKGDVDSRARSGSLGHRGNPGLSATGRFAHGIAEYRSEHRHGVFLLAGYAY